MADKVVIHSTHNGVIETQLKIEQLGADDRRETLTVTGGVHSVSDGYHTFDELYSHRITLFIALCKQFSLLNQYKCCEVDPAEFQVWRSRNHSDGEPAFGGTWFVLGINKEAGKQITYHLPMERWSETDFAETLDKAPEFDGHTSDDVLARIKTL